MIGATRRGAMIGALAVPTVAGLARWRWTHGERSVLLHDPQLDSGRRFAQAGSARGAEVRAIEGDPVRLAQAVVRSSPALIAGVSRHADFILLEDVAREAGYRPVATLYGRGARCAGHECLPGWQALGRMASGADRGWIEALADYAARPGEQAPRAVGSLPARPADSGLVLGWVLARTSAG